MYAEAVERDRRVGTATDADHLNSQLHDAVAIFVRMRPQLTAIAYRILGGASEAEDVVQEIWVRWQNMDRTVVAAPQALLVTMTARLAINVGGSARRRRETAVGTSPPDRADLGDDPATRVERRDAVERAVLLMMQRLTPRERAALILREAFDYPYGQLADFLQLRAANTRQLVSRARRRLNTDRQVVGSPESHERFVQAFLGAARGGDLATLEQVLAEDLAG
jgi:RNA polymerase sigma factor (sigma-70 family)